MKFVQVDAARESITFLFAVFKAGYKLKTQRHPKIRLSRVPTERIVVSEITGSGRKKLKVMNNPAETPIIPLTKIINVT